MFKPCQKVVTLTLNQIGLSANKLPYRGSYFTFYHILPISDRFILPSPCTPSFPTTKGEGHLFFLSSHQIGKEDILVLQRRKLVLDDALRIQRGEVCCSQGNGIASFVLRILLAQLLVRILLSPLPKRTFACFIANRKYKLGWCFFLAKSNHSSRNRGTETFFLCILFITAITTSPPAVKSEI